MPRRDPSSSYDARVAFGTVANPEEETHAQAPSTLLRFSQADWTSADSQLRDRQTVVAVSCPPRFAQSLIGKRAVLFSRPLFEVSDAPLRMAESEQS